MVVLTLTTEKLLILGDVVNVNTSFLGVVARINCLHKCQYNPIRRHRWAVEMVARKRLFHGSDLSLGLGKNNGMTRSVVHSNIVLRS